MEGFVYTEKLITESKHVRSAFNEMMAIRKLGNSTQEMMLQQAFNAGGVNSEMYAANSTAFMPDDVWREVDTTTDRVMRDDEGQGYMMDLAGLAKPIRLGKSASFYRNASDGDFPVSRSVGGQQPESLNKVRYEHDGDPITIFQNEYGRGWYEWLSHQTEGFDSLSDDQEACLAAIKRDMARYYLTGDSNIVIDGKEGEGIINHRNTEKINIGAGGLNVDLINGTPDEIIKFFTEDFAMVLDSNLVDKVDKLWVSPQMMRSFGRPYSGSNNFKEGTIKDYIIRYGRVSDIQRTYELGRDPVTDAPNADGFGNEFFAYVRNQRVIAPIIAAPVGVVPVARTHPMDNFQFLAWGAMGLRIKADYNGKKGVFYAGEL